MSSTSERKGLGQVVRALREHEGLTRVELGERAQLGPDMIAKVEQGAKSPSAASLRRIATALGVDVTELSSRSLAWSALLADGERSTTVLRSVAVGSYALADALRRTAPAAQRGLVTAATLSGAAGVAGTALVIADRRDRKKIETELRALLDKRLQEAESDADLGAIAEALRGTITSGSTPSAPKLTETHRLQ